MKMSTFSSKHVCGGKSRLLRSAGGRKSNPSSLQQEFIVLVYILPTVAAILCYINGLDGDFVHDDRYAIRDNPDATGKAPLKELFWNDFWGKPMCDNTSHKSYRPLTVLTFRLDYHLGGGDPWWFHSINIALHAAVTWLFVHVLRHVVHVQDIVTALAALLFAVHPVHTEAVTGIVGRAELLSCLGVLLSLLCYARSLGVHHNGVQPVTSSPRYSQAVYFWLAMVFSGAAMLCKEHGIMGLGICAVLDVFIFSGQATKRWVCTRRRDPDLYALARRLSAIVCVGVLLMWFRLWMMCGQMPAFRDEDNPASFSTSFLTRVLTFNYLVAFNVLRLFLCPCVLSYDWQGGSIPLVTSLNDVRNIDTLTVYAIMVFAAWRCLHVFLRDFLRGFSKQDDTVIKEDHNNNPIKSDTLTCTKENNNNNTNNNNNNNNNNIGNGSSSYHHKQAIKCSSNTDNGDDVLLVAMVMMALPFLPSSNLFFRVGFVVAERVLYIPSLGFCLLVAHGASGLWEKYQHSRHRYPRWCIVVSTAILIVVFAAKTYNRNYAWTSRESLFKSGLQTLPDNAKMHYNYANFLKDSGDTHRAVLHYKTAISLYPSQPSYHNNLGTVVEDDREAERCYRKALSLHPTHRGALVNLGNVLINRNDTSGEQLLRQALNIDPHYTDALLSLSQLELRRGRWEKAEAFIKEGLRQRPDMPDLYHFYGIVFHKTGRYEEAVASYKRAVTLNNQYTAAMTNAAASLRQLGRELEAEDLLKRAVSASQDVEAMGQLGQIYQRTGRTQDALAIFSQMAQRAPNDTGVLLGFVQTLMDNGQLRQAGEVLTHLLSSAPQNAEVLFAMGHVTLGLGQSQEALSVFREALRWAKGDNHLMGKIYHEIGNIFKDLKNYPEALQNYQSSLKEDPSLVHSHHNIGALYHIMGNYDKAREHYQQVLQTDPDNQMLLQNLAKLQRSIVKQGKRTAN